MKRNVIRLARTNRQRQRKKAKSFLQCSPQFHSYFTPADGSYIHLGINSISSASNPNPQAHNVAKIKGVMEKRNKKRREQAADDVLRSPIWRYRPTETALRYRGGVPIDNTHPPTARHPHTCTVHLFYLTNIDRYKLFSICSQHTHTTHHTHNRMDGDEKLWSGTLNSNC